MIKTTLSLLILFLSVKAFGQNTMSIDTSKVYLFADTMPTLPNGKGIPEGFLEFFINEFRYPDSLVCIVDKMRFEFTVSYDGTLTDKNVIISDNKDCEKEIAILKKIGSDLLDIFPKCTPGVKQGKFVKVKFSIPIAIELKE